MRKPQDFYINFELNDFLDDDDFKKWVKYPEAEDEEYWKGIILAMPQKNAVISAARNIIFLLSRPVLTDQEEGFERVWTNIDAHVKGRSGKSTLTIRPFASWQWVTTAAVLLVMLSFGLFTYIQQKSRNQFAADNVGRNIVPGSNRATLVLANGKTIDLNDAANGKLAEQAGITVEKTADGRLVYKTNHSAENSSLATNTIRTPRGGQYELILPDQTHVWLNAASSITYPVSFNQMKQRLVDLTGEAYFQVSHDKDHPFIVHTATQSVQVLGTQFNINSYTEEGKTVTTLEQGSVRINTAVSSLSALLIPGQQSVFTGKTLHVQPADLETTLSWKNGRFEFKDADIQTIMREVSRWYNIEVEYQGEIPERKFFGSVPRQSKLSTLLQLLKLSDINFEVRESAKGKTLVVIP